jgi:hypothetical protein
MEYCSGGTLYDLLKGKTTTNKHKQQPIEQTKKRTNKQTNKTTKQTNTHTHTQTKQKKLIGQKDFSFVLKPQKP